MKRVKTSWVVDEFEYWMLSLSGGAFGGKEIRTFLVTLPTAIAAQRYYML